MRSSKQTLLLTALTISLTVLSAFSQIAQSSQATPAPESQPALAIAEDGTKELALAPEQSVSTFIPCVSAPGNGIAVNIIYPQKPRYKDGAPIAVVVAGGDSADGLSLCVHAAQVGFIEIRFAFPGGGIGKFKSGGYNDYRGAKSQRALRDILLFAAGKGEDFRHRSINDLVPIKLDTNNVGLVGWSNGGNIALITMEKYASQLAFLRWLALYECPLGSLFFPPSLGSTHDIVLNKHYRQGSAATGHCLIDFRQLTWQGDIKQHPGVHKKLGEPDLPGVVYFDDNKNARWDETTEFAFNYALDKGLSKEIYPPDVTSAMERLKIFEPYIPPEPAAAPVTIAPVSKEPRKLQDTAKATAKAAVTTIIRVVEHTPKPRAIPFKPPKTADTKEDGVAVPVHGPTKNWPSTVATLEESESYFQERDGSLSIPALCNLYPNILITILANQVDHLQTQPDHPHIVLQYNAWLENGAHWVRLNPDSVYLATLADMNKRNFVQSEHNAPLDATNIAEYLEPKGILKDYVFLDATIAELADRYRSKNNAGPLVAPIYSYSNGASLPAAVANTAPVSSETPKKAPLKR